MLKRKVIQKQDLYDFETREEIKNQTRLYYDIMKNPVQIDVQEFFHQPIIMFLWQRYTKEGHYQHKLKKYSRDQLAVLKITINYFTKHI
jgi:hypothetical protein